MPKLSQCSSKSVAVYSEATRRLTQMPLMHPQNMNKVVFLKFKHGVLIEHPMGLHLGYKISKTTVD